MTFSNPSTHQPKPPKPFSAEKPGHGRHSQTKASNDRHVKVNGRDRRVRIPVASAERVFQLTHLLGHRSSGQTIEWLLREAEPAVNQVLSNAAADDPNTPPVAASPQLASVESRTPYAAEAAPAAPENQASIAGEGAVPSSEDESFSFDCDLAAEFMSFPLFF
ncbi:hypothetical protein U1Q18_021029 [Sarracenia purpurea var. burkii]